MSEFKLTTVEEFEAATALSLIHIQMCIRDSEKGKGVIIAVNKWDAIEKNDKTIYKHTNRIREVLSFMPYAEIVFISARTGLRISRMFETLDAVIENQTMRIQTGAVSYTHLDHTSGADYKRGCQEYFHCSCQHCS